MLADFLGFAGAIGIQIIVSSLQDDIGDMTRDQMICSRTNMTNTDHDEVNESDTMTISQFLHNRLVAAVIILLASLLQGAFSQVIVPICTNYSYYIIFCISLQILNIWTLAYKNTLVFAVIHYEFCYLENLKQMA